MWPVASRTGLLVAVLRASGKRTLAKLSAFDFVVTVALGSTLATIALSSEVAIVEGAVALATLVALQFAVAWGSSRSAALRGALKSGPTVVVRDGVLQREEMRRQRLGPDEVRQAVRASGVGGMEMIGFVVLETDGTLSVITKDQCGSGNALCDVHLLPAPSSPPR